MDNDNQKSLRDRCTCPPEEFSIRDLSIRDDLAKEIFIDSLENVGDFASTETIQSMANRSVIAANCFINAIEEASK